MDSNTTNLIWWVIGLPILGWLVQSLFGKTIVQKLGFEQGKKVLGALAVAPVAAAFAVGVVILNALVGMPEGERAIVAMGPDWVNLQSIRIPFELRIDPLSMTMVMVITGIGALIHLYATGYMSEEREFSRFFGYLNLFVAMMLVLVLGNNLALLFVGWEGVGLCSYLLIGFWYKDLGNAKAANKAFIVNRIGDVGLTLGIFMLAILAIQNRVAFGEETRWLSYDVLLPQLPEMLNAQPWMATVIGLLLFVGAMGKSAQFPLYLWLPDAMAGPTPVSALIHAATMVTSGVVLLNRMQEVFTASYAASFVVMVVGLFTAIFAALIAFGQTDIKKVLAYSTVSQLGFMFIACGVGAYWVGMFHVITHAFFKALLFLGSGAVIHAMSHEQDMRHYGKLSKAIPITFVTMLIGYFAIAGVPYTSGWFSKEEVIHKAFGSEISELAGINFGVIVGFLAFFAALLTAIYMTRMMMLTFAGDQQRWRQIPAQVHDHHHDEHHAHHEHHEHEDHGPDVHGFFYNDAEMAAQKEEHAHHHSLDKSHEPHEVPWSMWVPLAVLAVFALISGYWLFAPGPWAEKGHLLETWLASGQHVSHSLAGAFGEGHHDKAHEIPYKDTVKVLGYSVGLIGMVIGFLWYRRGLPKAEGWDLSRWSGFRRSAKEQFGYDRTMVDAGVEGGGTLGNWLWKGFDSKGIDGVANGLGTGFRGVGSILRKMASGYARSYALYMLIGSVAFIGYLVYLFARMGGRS